MSREPLISVGLDSEPAERSPEMKCTFKLFSVEMEKFCGFLEAQDWILEEKRKSNDFSHIYFHIPTRW